MIRRPVPKSRSAPLFAAWVVLWGAALVLLAGAAAIANAQEPGKTVASTRPSSQDRIDQIASSLIRLDHRMSGTAAGRAAGDIILEELKRSGVDDVVVQSFPVVALDMAPGDCTLESGGKSFPLEPLRPNGLALPVTGTDGIAGRTVNLGDGEWKPIGDALARGPIRDRIAVMSLNCGDRWLRAVELGARAIVFVDDAGTNQGADQASGQAPAWLSASANIPRYFAPGATVAGAGLLNDAQVRIRCRMNYRAGTGRNIAAFIAPRSSAPAATKPSAKDARPAVVLATAYDTFGLTPFDSPSPRGAFNVAGLLQVGAWLKANPPDGPVILLFLDNEAQDQSGQLAFHFARLRSANPLEPHSIQGILASAEQESAWLAASKAALGAQGEGSVGHLDWRAWLPTLVTNLLFSATLILVGLAGVDLWRVSGGGAKPGFGLWAKSIGAVVAIAATGCFIIYSPDIFRPEADASGKAPAAWADGDLLRHAQQLHEDCRDRITELSYESVALDQDVKLSSATVQKTLPEQAAGMFQRPPDSLLAWRKLALERRNVRGPQIESELAGLKAREKELAGARVALMNGVKYSKDAPQDRVNQVIGEIIADREALLSRRHGELELETRCLQDAKALGDRLRQARPGMMLMLDLDPSGAPWYLQTPSSGGLKDLVVNQDMDRWLDAWSLKQAAPKGAGDGGGFAGKLAGVSPIGQDRWGVSAQAMFLAFAVSPPTPRGAGSGEVWGGLKAGPEGKLRGIESLVRSCVASEPLAKARVPDRVASLFFNVPEWDARARQVAGNVVKRYGGGGGEAETPVGGAVVSIEPGYGSHSADVAVDRWGCRLAMTSTDGAFPVMASSDRRVVMTGTLVDEQGRIVSVTQLRPGWPIAGSADWNRVGSFSASINNKLCMFDSIPVVVAGIREDPWSPQPTAAGMRLTRGVGDADFNRLSASLDRGIAGIYVDRLSELKVINGRQLLLNNWPDMPLGIGYPRPDGVFDAGESAAADLWTLNENRLDKLRSNGIFDDSIEQLHDKAENWLKQSRLQSGVRPGDAAAAATASVACSGSAYGPIRAITDDLVRAVVILLLLSVPFAFAVERLLVASTNIYKQIGAFTGIFAAVFLVLYFVHPAFRFAAFPMVILLAFSIIVMSSLVIVIMWGKFEYEMKNMQGVAMASHRSSRNASATVLAAMNQGIASMRQRPLRTFLTAMTIILLTFTTILFGSFSAGRGIRSVYLGPASGPARVEVQLPGGRLLDAGAARTLRALWRDRATSFVRHWATAADSAGGKLPIVFGDGHVEPVTAWLAISPLEAAGNPALRDALGLSGSALSGSALSGSALSGSGLSGSGLSGSGLTGVDLQGGPLLVLPRSAHAAAATQANQATGAPDSPSALAVIDGRAMPFVRSFDPEGLLAVTTISGARLVPPDVGEMTRQLELQNPGEPEAVKRQLRQLDAQAFASVDPSSLAVIIDPHMEDTDQTGAVVLLPSGDADARQIAGEIAQMTGEPVIVAAGGRVERLFYGASLSVGGLGRIVAPLLLGGLIIFGTMLSSVTDREKEIFTFAALGMAPVHVGVLFFAEASVFSLVGGMFGYLLTYVFGKGTQFLSEHGLGAPLHLNYSSTDAMFAMLLVMATVMASTVYPALLASRSANPGIQRNWRIPRPVGDRYDILFPFTVSEHDIIGLIGFLEEYMVSHRDRSVGSFAAADVLAVHADGRFSLAARLWLQPFDQGVSQTFELLTRPSDIEGIDEITIRLVRLSGPRPVWERGNAVFIHDLRQQFIFWRTIDETMTDHYHQRTREKLGLPMPEAGQQGGDA